MSAAQMAYEMGCKAVEPMLQTPNGEEVPESVDSGADVITIGNAEARLETLKEQLGESRYIRPVPHNFFQTGLPALGR